MNKFIKLFVAISIFNCFLSVSAEELKNGDCDQYNIRIMLKQKDLDPLTRNKKIWARILKDSYGLEKYKIYPNSKEEEMCIKSYILHHAFDINNYSRELVRGGE